jgi:hypothetical protein
VNLAARIEPLAGPGGIVVSRAVQEQVGNKLEAPLARLGRAELKNIEGGLEVFRVVLPWQRGAPVKIVSEAERHWRQAAPWAVATILALVCGALLWSRPEVARRSTTGLSAPVLRKFDLRLPVAHPKQSDAAPLYPVVSPDGRKLAYADAEGVWVKWLDRFTPPVQLAKVERAGAPIWSPGSAHLAYFDGAKLFRVAIEAGRPMLLCTAPEEHSPGASGGAWLQGDRIIFATGNSQLFEVPAQGGKMTVAVAVGDGENDLHEATPLPGGRGVLFTVHRAQGIDTIACWTPGGARKILLQKPGSRLWRPVYSPSGHVIFHLADAGGGLWAFPFSLERLGRTGEPFRISDLGAEPSVSLDGTLVLSLVGEDEWRERQLAWVDRSGRVVGTIGKPLPGLADPRLSPDGTRIVARAGVTDDSALWLFDAATGSATPFTKTRGADVAPSWGDQGRTVRFLRRDTTAPYGPHAQWMAKPVDGLEPERMVLDDLAGYTAGTALQSADGQHLLARKRTAAGKVTLSYGRMTNGPIQLTPVPDAYQNVQVMDGWKLSPDSRRLAFSSSEFSRAEVYVVRFPEFTEKVMVSRDGGRHPEWHPAGTELFYLSRTGRALMSARLRADGKFDEPGKVFDLPEEIHGGFEWRPSFYDVAPEGERFLMLKRADPEETAVAARPNVLIVQNWFEEFREKK